MEKTILLVDDEVNILKVLKRLLSEKNYNILTVASAAEGLQVLKEHAVQVIITDQRMPNMTGSDFLKEVKKLYPDTVRMILSGYADFDAIKDAINDGAIYKFINKPWDDEQLIQYVQESFQQLQIRKLQQEKEKSVHLDALTQLKNRFSFNEAVYLAIIQANRQHAGFAVVYIDIDRFSNVNNLLGQAEGDKVLKLTAERLNQFYGANTAISRLGNDEFAILIEDQQLLNDLDAALHKLVAELKVPMKINLNDLYFTYSIGCSLYPQHGDDPNTLMKNANNAMKHCMQLGGDNHCIYQPELDKTTANQLILEADLHQALKNNEFVVHYQPILDPNTSKIKNIEALLRWQHPTLGLIYPGQFLSLCETTGLIVPIGEWMMRQACLQIKSWHKMGFTQLCVAVNLSARQFNHAGLLNSIISLLQETRVPPASLELEITESLIIQNVENNISLLKSLRALGVQLALDDFGTGYSSLSYLKSFPFNILKVDKSFIDDVVHTKGSAAIVKAIIEMGKGLGLTVIAEGVETQEQLDFLKLHKCDLIQGYYFSKPIPEAELTQLLYKTES
jgi:diguanylate cyclase (GGDEF)-like protein